MTEYEATIRDMQTSLERAGEKMTKQAEEIKMLSGIVRTLSFSMQMNSEARSLDEARWQDVARWLARQLAQQSDSPYFTAAQWFTKALEATEEQQKESKTIE